MKNQKNLVVMGLALALTGFAGCTKEVNSLKPIVDPDRDKGGTIKAPIDPSTVENWFTKGAEQNVEGVNAETAYASLNLAAKAQTAVIVAVIDSGVDIEHEDLAGKIWTNDAEKNGTAGVDDDKNGYVDDIHGWNYIGGYDEQGKPVHVDAETLEITREMARLKKLKAAQGKLSPEDEALLEKVTKAVTEARTELEEIGARSKKGLETLAPLYEKVKDLLGVEFKSLTTVEVQKAVPTNDEQKAALEVMMKAFAEAKAATVARLLTRVETVDSRLGTWFNEDHKAREEIVKDDPNNLDEKGYGNNDVEGLGADHGTHVSGIIGAVRGNGVGVDGIAENVKIMSLRAVPNGDERDKDVALAVRYAADNGARVINMSFGKALSPNKSKVDEAFVYAASKGVVIVHAAGNSNADNDVGDNFPNRYIKTPNPLLEIPTWIEVGASSRFNDERLPAVFSNFGQNSVDVFAPGVDLNSTTPDNTYSIFSGTSMASPTVAGVAALLISLHPELTGAEIRNLVLQNTRSRADLSVLLPGSEKKVDFGLLSRTGGIVDVMLALSGL